MADRRQLEAFDTKPPLLSDVVCVLFSFYLVVVEFEWGLSSEDLDHDGEFLFLFVDFLYFSREAGEWAVGDFDSLADCEWYFVLGGVVGDFIDSPDHACGLGGSHWLRLRVAEEAENVGYACEYCFGLGCEYALDEYVAGVEDVLFEYFFAVTLLIYFLDGYDGCSDHVTEVAPCDLGLDVLFGFFFFAADSSEDVPGFLVGFHEEGVYVD